MEVEDKGKDGPWPENNEDLFIDLMMRRSQRATETFSQIIWVTTIIRRHAPITQPNLPQIRHIEADIKLEGDSDTNGKD